MKSEKNHEYDYTGKLLNGFVMLAVVLIPYLLLAIGVGFMLAGAVDAGSGGLFAFGVVLEIIMFALVITLACGFFTQQPNESRVMIFFGSYRGTCRNTGFFWVNPFMSRKKVPLRINNMDVEPIKVNDKIGNPVMIGMVLVWKVKDTYKAVFDVNTTATIVTKAEGITTDPSALMKSLSAFVRIQSDAALREVTGQYAYDNVDGVNDELTLRGGGEEINNLLEDKINERLAMAGIEVVEARINYLAYAPEIAAVMLRRQQASAIISAREKIVEGAVSMVKMALNQLSQEQTVELDEERKAAMVSNLLVVLCADEPAQPVLNTGTLYQ